MTEPVWVPPVIPAIEDSATRESKALQAAYAAPTWWSEEIANQYPAPRRLANVPMPDFTEYQPVDAVPKGKILSPRQAQIISRGVK